MIHFLITLLVVVMAPIPWWLMLFHFFIQRGQKQFAKIAYFSIIIILLLLGYFVFKNNHFIFDYTFFPTLLTKIGGGIFFLLAVIVDWQVIKTFGYKRLAMLPEFRGQNDMTHFVATGIYQYGRHPRYVEYMLASMAAGLFFGNIFMLVFTVYLFISFWLATSVEERELISRFGDTYLEYQKQVKRFFII